MPTFLLEHSIQVFKNKLFFLIKIWFSICFFEIINNGFRLFVYMLDIFFHIAACLTSQVGTAQRANNTGNGI